MDVISHLIKGKCCVLPKSTGTLEIAYIIQFGMNIRYILFSTTDWTTSFVSQTQVDSVKGTPDSTGESVTFPFALRQFLKVVECIRLISLLVYVVP